MSGSYSSGNSFVEKVKDECVSGGQEWVQAALEGQSLSIQKNLTLVVAAILIENDKILMVCESKPSCYGLWYLPAGRVDPCESLEDAFKRELVEESHIEGSPDHIVDIHFIPSGMGGAMWARFTFVGHRTGGKLKTLNEKDKESLEAQWFNVDEVICGRIKLRSFDIIRSIKLALERCDDTKMQKLMPCMPVAISHKCGMLRAIVIRENGERFSVFRSVETGSMPLVARAVGSVESLIEDALREKYNYKGALQVIGALSVEHSPGEIGVSDGLCLNVLCRAVPEECSGDAPATVSQSFEWVPLSTDLCILYKQILESNSFGHIG